MAHCAASRSTCRASASQSTASQSTASRSTASRVRSSCKASTRDTVGTVINPMQLHAQIQGSVAQALGWALYANGWCSTRRGAWSTRHPATTVSRPSLTSRAPRSFSRTRGIPSARSGRRAWESALSTPSHRRWPTRLPTRWPMQPASPLPRSPVHARSDLPPYLRASRGLMIGP
jgi:hypothetical protein